MSVTVHALMLAALGTPGAPPEAPVDTTYGRIDGDIGLVLGAGVTVAGRGPRATVDMRLRYLDTVGAFATYEDGPLVSSHTDPRRVIATGLELRPLFLARWLRGAETGIARLDLAIDSIGIDIGAFFAQPEGAPLGARPGFQIGLGMELPILPRASGPWIGIHGAARWSDAALGGDILRGPSDRALVLSITLAWHQLVGAHVVDLNDTAPK